MRGGSYADLIRRLARQSDEDVPTQPPSNARRLVAAVEQALHARARRRAVFRRASIVGFAAAASLALALGARAWRDAATPIVAHGDDLVSDPHALTFLGADDAGAAGLVNGARVSLRPGLAIGAGVTLRAPTSGELRVGTTEGTSLALEAGGELRVTEAGATQRLALESGAVVARVSRPVRERAVHRRHARRRGRSARHDVPRRRRARRRRVRWGLDDARVRARGRRAGAGWRGRDERAATAIVA